VHLKQAIDFGSACVAVLGPAVCAAGFGLQAGQSDGHTELKGNDVAFGYNAGLLAEPIPGTRLGVSYRSRIDHRFGSAKQTFDVPATARAFLAAGGTPASAFTGSDVSTALQLPARFTLGAMQTVAKGLDVYLDATLTKWGVLDATVITPKNLATGAAVVINQNYQDAWRYAIGANYVWNDEWSVRAGLAYDETPIPTAFVQATIPDRDRVYYSLGASYRVNKVLSVDVGYTHVRYVGEVPIDRAGPSGDRLFGRFDVGGNIVAAQVKFQP
jgi:long-chain fatty acid transport protein